MPFLIFFGSILLFIAGGTLWAVWYGRRGPQEWEDDGIDRGTDDWLP